MQKSEGLKPRGRTAGVQAVRTWEEAASAALAAGGLTWCLPGWHTKGLEGLKCKRSGCRSVETTDWRSRRSGRSQIPSAN